MKEESKKKWNKPKLIILTRGKSGERVLIICKNGSPSGPAIYAYNCQQFAVGCPPCEDVTGS